MRFSRRTTLTVATAVLLAAGTTAAAASAARTHSSAPPVNVVLDGSFAFHACAAPLPAADGCLTDHVSGTLPGIGAVTSTFEVHIAWSQVPGGSCAPIDKHGAFITADGSTLSLEAAGMFCSASGTASYDYRVVKGTGALAHRGDGHGQWLVPPPATYDNGVGTGPEDFFGTLIGD